MIEFNSEQDSGTEVRVALTFDNAMPSASLTADSDETAITKVRKIGRGLKACLAAFDASQSIVGIPRGKLSVKAKRMLSLRSYISSLLTSCFQMEVTLSSLLNSSSVNIVIAMESEFKSSNLQRR